VQTYEKSEPFNGDPKRAIEFAVKTLTAATFTVEQRTDTLVKFRCPRRLPNRAPVLPKVLSIELRFSGNTVTAHAILMEYPILQRMVGRVLFFGALIYFYYHNISSDPQMTPEFRHFILGISSLMIVISIATMLFGARAYLAIACRGVDRFVRNICIEAQGASA